MKYEYGIQPETGLVHVFTRIDDGKSVAWHAWCRGHLVLTWTRWKRAPDDATPTCIYCAISRPH